MSFVKDNLVKNTPKFYAYLLELVLYIWYNDFIFDEINELPSA